MTPVQTSRAAFPGIEHLLSNAVVGTVHADMRGQLLHVNRCMADMLGYTPEELAGRTVADITHPDDLAASQAQIANVKAGSPGFVVEKRYMHRDGGVVWALSNVTALRDAHGGAVGLLALVQDITERKENECRMGFLAELSHRLARVREEGDIVRTTVESLGRHVGAHRC